MAVTQTNYYDAGSSIDAGTNWRGQPVVCREGDGSASGLTCERDRQATTRRDSGLGQTTFYADEEGVDNPEYWARLRKLHEEYMSKGGERQNREHRVAVFEALASALELPEHEWAEARELVAQDDTRNYRGVGGYTACALANIARAQNRGLEKFENRIQAREDFQRLVQSTGVNLMKSIKKAG